MLLATALAAAAPIGAGCGRERQAAGGGAQATARDRAGTMPGPAATDTAANEMAAVSHILVAYKGCLDARPGLERTREEAEDRARRIAVLASEPGADFAELARRYSDDPRAAQSGGYLGIFRRHELTVAIDVAVFAVQPNEVAGLVETEFGWHILQRLPVQRARAHHILIAWRGAAGANEAVTRTQEQARALVNEVRLRAVAPGADLCQLARQFSDDAANSASCGYLGQVVPGYLPPVFEQELFRLHPGEISEIVETPYGYHLAWRGP